jgi:putative thioredoxin
MLSGVQRPAAPSAPKAVIDVDERSFEQEVIVRSRQVPVVVDLWAPWCGPCRTLSPILERLATEAKGAWILAKVNVDENPRLSQMFRVQSIPAVMAVFQGKVVDQFVGALPESQIRAWLKRFVPEQPDSLIEAARALEDSDPEGAIGRYRLMLGEEPNNAAALFHLGRLLLLRGSPEGPETLRQVPAATPFFARAQAMLPLVDFLAVADEQPRAETSDLEVAYRRAAEAARRGEYEPALDGLLNIVARDRTLHNDGARKAMLGLFAALGDDHPLVPAYRRKLANTLF